MCSSDLLRSMADDMPLDQWLNKQVFPLEAKLTGEDIYDLPQTGGHGTWMYGVAGTVLMVAAAIILVSARRKKLGK